MYAKVSGVVRYVGLRMVVAKKIPRSKVFGHTFNNHSGTYNILFSTYVIIATAAILLVLNAHYIATTATGLTLCAVAFLYTAATHVLWYRRPHIATYLLLLFYIVLTGGIMWAFGVDMSIGMLILGLVIVFAGLLLSAAHALFTALVASIMIVGIQAAYALRWLNYDRLGGTLELGDLLACCALFIVLALVVWLHARKREYSLARSKQAEVILLEQKAALKVQGKKHTIKLRQMQLEEMRHMYRFAELGQHGMTLLHDFANHLTALRLETEALKDSQHAKAILPTQRIIQGLNEIIESTYDRLHGGCQKQRFNLITRINETIDFLQNKARQTNTKIEWQPPACSWEYTGDAASLSQVLAIIMSNAIDAYGAPQNSAFPPRTRRVSVTVERSETDFIIRIGDWGKGIPKPEQKYLFQPFRSTKKSGLGLGLYIAKNIMEMQFSGTVELNPQSDHTEFVVTLPINEDKS